jgi:hypothetical protein
MLNKDKFYLFHNVYGDADDLIATAPSNVITIPYGWDEKTEAYRNEIIKAMNFMPSVLPAVMYFAKEIRIDEHEVDGLWVPNTYIPPRWQEVRVLDMPKPWTWTDIISSIEPHVS